MAISEKIVSPGVFTKEIDQTFLPAAIADIGAVVVGPTVKGPVMNPTIVTSYSDFQSRFGDSFQSSSNYYQYLTSHTAREYLKNNDKLTVVRILAGSYSHATASISSSVDPAVVGGGLPHTGSLTLVGPKISLLGFDASASFTPYGGTKVNFSFTSSTETPGLTNTSTQIYVPSKSGGDAAASLHRQALSLAHALGSSSLHGLELSASAAAAVVNITMSNAGEFGTTGSLKGITPLARQGASQPQQFLEMVGSGVGTDITITSKSFGGGRDFNHGISGIRNSTTMSVAFTLNTMADGTLMDNTTNARGGKNGILPNGNSNNIRWEITSRNNEKGTFSLVIRRGDDITDRKQILETFNNLTLDPNSNDYITKRIGDQVLTIKQSGTNDPYLQLSGSYPNKSKYVRVGSVNMTTIDYLDENGNLREPGASASLPTFASGSNSGSFAGSFGGGSDGDQSSHPHNFYENITQANTQGLNLSADATGETAYLDALNLLGNQDEYDFNLLLLPGILDDTHNSIVTKAINTCQNRGDCFVLVDPVSYASSISDVKTEAETRDTNYAAVYWPWVQIPDNQTGTNRWVPPSVAIAGIYAFNDRVSHEWFAPAGLNRGTLDTAVQIERKLIHSDRDDLYNSNVNPIATFPNQGITVFGQKTLQKKASALDRVNVRRLLIKLKKFIASSSRFLVFEQNNTATRRRFLNIVNPYLEQVQSNSGLTAFKVVMDESNNTPDIVDRNILYGQIFIQPTRTAEFIVLDFTVQPSGATFSE